MTQLQVTSLCISALKPSPHNPRTHTKRQIRQIANSIKTFGFTNPVLVDDNGNILAGHGRIEAAKLLGIETVPTICLEDMSEAERRAYVITDNRLAEEAGWDRELLAIEFQYLTELDINFDITLTGFETPEIDLIILEYQSAGELEEDDEVPEVDETSPPVSRPGDLWKLGPHRLLCGDARDSDAFSRLMDGQYAQMVFTDPPYNLPIQGHVSGLGTIKHEDFEMASGEMNSKEFTDFLKEVLGNLARYCADGSVHYIFMDWRHIDELLSAGRTAYTELKNVCVWNKDNAGMGTFYRSKHELVFAFKYGTAPHINNFELGQHGRYRTNVWDYPGLNTFREGRMDDLSMHPTVKPVALVADAILDCSHRTGIVLDPFVGSGTTLMAAERTGRRCSAMEIDPRYIDVAIRRWEKTTGDNARLVDSGATFAELAADRTQEVNHA